MPKYIFTGPETNLGRFGTVRKGDTLNLTPHEERHIDGDKRFELFEEAKHGQKAAAKKTIQLPKDFDKMKPDKRAETLKALGLPDNFEKLSEAEQSAALGKSDSDETARQEQIEQRNMETKIEEIRQLTLEQLRDLVKTLRQDGKVIDIKEDSAEAKNIRRAIIGVLFGDNSEE